MTDQFRPIVMGDRGWQYYAAPEQRSLWICTDCGSLVLDIAKHEDWHGGQK